jgi:hypothetical protein
MNMAAEPDAGWRSFMTEPVAYIAPERLARCFGGALPAAFCERMLATPRLADRLSQTIVSHYRLPPTSAEDSVEAADKAIALTPTEAFPEIASRSGAIMWSAAIANTVMARDVSALHSAIGEALCSFAVTHRELAGPELPLAPFATLAERIAADGWRCLAAWCDAVDSGVGARARLKFPVLPILEAPLPAAFASAGPAIVRRAAAAV